MKKLKVGDVVFYESYLFDEIAWIGVVEMIDERGLVRMEQPEDLALKCKGEAWNIDWRKVYQPGCNCFYHPNLLVKIGVL